jgi:hypothetical protein
MGFFLIGFNYILKLKFEILTEENIPGFFESNKMPILILHILLQLEKGVKQMDILRNQVLVLLLSFTKEKVGTRQIISKFGFKE